MTRIRELREAKGWTQTELGKQVGVNQSAIDKYESGHIVPPVNRLYRLADAFGVSLDYLVGRTDNPGGL